MSVWWVIGALGLGTYLTRFVFLGLVGDRALPPWVMRHIRYTGVAVLPGLVAPLVIWPEGGTDPARVVAALVTVAVGVWRKDAITAVAAGVAAFVALRWVG
ncbi:MAG: AzlD domain-containing protein [Pseudomonadota bacterium]